LAQPNFNAQANNFNLIFRIPTPVFGAGLIENTPDLTLQANLAATASQRANFGIAGKFNTSGNDGTITRFGWKAQNKSLLIFAGEAYNVEMGVSNEGFPNERAAVPGCVFNPTPEDSTNFFDTGVTPPGSTTTTTQVDSDIVNFALFMRLAAPPTPTTASASELRGVRQRRLRALPLTIVDHGGIVHRPGHEQRYLSSVLGHRASPHGLHAGRRRDSRRGWTG
jgi:CxxC motif-containing protein (DUF1111 family)